MLAAYDQRTNDEKIQLLMLTSDVRAEYMQAAKVQHRIHCDALVAASKPGSHEKRGWRAREVQHNVSKHMGWLAKAQAIGVLARMSCFNGLC